MTIENKKFPNNQTRVDLTPLQSGSFFRVIAKFLPENSKIREMISGLSKKTNNPNLCGDVVSFSISATHPFLSLATTYGPSDRFSRSPLGQGKSGSKAVNTLKFLPKNLDVKIANKKTIQETNIKKLPLEMQLMLKQGKNVLGLTDFLEKDGILLFVKRKKVDKDVENSVYNLSVYAGRRFDWLDVWIKNPEDFNLINHFGKRNEKELEKIKKLLDKLKKDLTIFFQIVPIDKNGAVDKSLEKQLNDPIQPIENAYALMILKKQDTAEDIRTVKYATIMSIPTIGLISLILGGDNNANQNLKLISARSIAPILADAITYWAEISPFISRNIKFKQRAKDFFSILISNYKTSLSLTLIGTPAGQLFINPLIATGNNIGSGLIYGVTPLVPAIVTTAQSAINEHTSTTALLKELNVNGFAKMSNHKLWLESILKTVKHPARLGLLVAGLIGVFEGMMIGKAELLSNPIALTFVGELNEALLTALWLFSYDKIIQLKYMNQVKRMINDESFLSGNDL